MLLINILSDFHCCGHWHHSHWISLPVYTSGLVLSMASYAILWADPQSTCPLVKWWSYEEKYGAKWLSCPSWKDLVQHWCIYSKSSRGYLDAATNRGQLLLISDQYLTVIHKNCSTRLVNEDCALSNQDNCPHAAVESSQGRLLPWFCSTMRECISLVIVTTPT